MFTASQEMTAHAIRGMIASGLCAGRLIDTEGTYHRLLEKQDGLHVEIHPHKSGVDVTIQGGEREQREMLAAGFNAIHPSGHHVALGSGVVAGSLFETGTSSSYHFAKFSLSKSGIRYEESQTWEKAFDRALLSVCLMQHFTSLHRLIALDHALSGDIPLA